MVHTFKRTCTFVNLLCLSHVTYKEILSKFFSDKKVLMNPSPPEDQKYYFSSLENTFRKKALRSKRQKTAPGPGNRLEISVL
jgi:hypothetical protein